VPEHGRFAIVTGSQGAHFALWQFKDKVTPTKDNDKTLKKPPTPFTWHELNVKDADAAVKFYKSALSWTTHDHPMGPEVYHMFALKGEKDAKKCFGGVGKLEGDAPPHWLIYIDVKNCDETVAKISEHGGKILKPAFDVPTVGRMATVADPQGAVFAVFQPAPKSEKMDDTSEGEKKRPSRGKGKKKEDKDDDEKPEKKEKKAPAKSRGKSKRKAAESVDDEESGDKDKKEKDDEANGDEGEDEDKPKKKKSGRARGKKAKTDD
jgi:predicted enzyme related to lactoylglutathione lyase